MIKTALKDKGITDENIIVIPTGFILDVVEPLDERGLNIKSIYAGGKGDSDNRMASYKKLLEVAKMPGSAELIKDHYNLDITYKDTMNGGPRLEGVSGTKVREALLNNDFDAFEKGTGYDKAMFNKLKRTIIAGKETMELNKLMKKRK